MKKKLIIIKSFIMVVILIMIGILLKKNSYQELNNYLNNGSNLSFFYETESGEYVPGDSFASLSDIYSLNVSRSTCDNGLEGIEWDGKNKTLLLPTNKSNRCKLVFDINKKFTLLSYYPITERDAQITNMVKNGDFEDGYNYWGKCIWTMHDDPIVTNEKKSHGNSSLKFLANDDFLSCQILEQQVPILNHQYYMRGMVFTDENFTASDGRLEWYYNDTGLGIGQIGYGYRGIKNSSWNLISVINPITSSTYLSDDMIWRFRNFVINGTSDSYTDEIMLIDLTAGYGEDIPTKEELDSELIYFDGTVDIKTINSKKDGVFTVSNLPEDAEIECNNGGNAQISGGTVTITGDSAQTTCYIKEPHVPSIFDKCPGSTDLVSCLNNLQTALPGDETTTTDLCPNGIGGVIKHDGTIDAKDDGTIDDAGDNGYRYSGCNPNNYICFGKGSEDYNNGTSGATCDIKNKYRIIGIVPVTVGGETKNLVKVIKAEYLTEDEFGTKAGTASVSSTYDGIKRIESPQSGIPAYKWDTSNNNWSESTLYMSLNSDEPNGYKDKAFGENWKGKIETVKWNAGGVTDSYTSYNAQKMYEEEMKGQGATVDAQIGLMYAHDYGFASSLDNWQTKLYNYSKDENRNNNWMFNGVYEWTISRASSNAYRALDFGSTGYVSDRDVSLEGVAVRPVFYLKSTTQIIGDSTYNGSVAHPFKVQ